MKTQIDFIHRKDGHNIGDLLACPMRYLHDQEAEMRAFDVLTYDIRRNPDIIIVGGGGLIHPAFEGALQDLGKETDCRVIAWAIGHNIHGADRPDYPDWLHFYDLVGIRDAGSPFVRVPCPSCMHIALDAASMKTPKRLVSVYEHHLHPIRIHNNRVVMSNDLRAASAFEAMNFIATGKIVVTNSFHGAYWGMLLGRHVLMYEAFSTRHRYGLPRDPVHCDKSTVQQEIEKLACMPDPDPMLTLCREENLRFLSLVNDLCRTNLTIM